MTGDMKPGAKVLYTRAGPGTGDTIYVTEHGEYDSRHNVTIIYEYDSGSGGKLAATYVRKR